MNAAGALGGGLAGPVLVLVGYSGLGAVALVLVTVVVAWGLLQQSTERGIPTRWS